MPWADVVALEANLAVMGTGAALGRAMARAIEPFGVQVIDLIVTAVFGRFNPASARHVTPSSA